MGEEILDRGGGRGREEGEEGKEGLTQNHLVNSVTHLKSGCGSDWITHNTPFALSLFRFPPSPFPPETPDTQASLIKDKLEFKIFSSPQRKPKNGQNIGWNYKQSQEHYVFHQHSISILHAYNYTSQYPIK